MISTSHMEYRIGLILRIGTYLALLLVFIGGIWFLIINGQQDLQTELVQAGNYQTDIIHIVKMALPISPISLIQLGLLVLVITQILRIVPLVIYYALTRDRALLVISLFILMVLIYSLIVH